LGHAAQPARRPEIRPLRALKHPLSQDPTNVRERTSTGLTLDNCLTIGSGCNPLFPRHTAPFTGLLCRRLCQTGGLTQRTSKCPFAVHMDAIVAVHSGGDQCDRNAPINYLLDPQSSDLKTRLAVPRGSTWVHLFGPIVRRQETSEVLQSTPKEEIKCNIIVHCG
jgi:hypothetical protein